jgi:hypothetical protein
VKLNRRLFNVCLLLSWLLFTIWGFWYTQFSPLRVFDEKERVITLTEDPNHFKQLLKEALPTELAKTEGVMVHFYQNNCRCFKRAQQHITELKALASRKSLHNVELNIDHYPQLAKLIPATPATLLLDANDQLRYFGPYASGILCNSRNSLVETILQQIETEQQSVMPMEVVGCYCPTEQPEL